MEKLKSIILIGLLPLIGSMFVSCEKEDVDEHKWENTSISYLLTMSPDLLKFVSPEVTYVDSNGDVHVISGVKELDNLVNIGHSKAPFIDVWTIQTIEGTDYKCWNLQMTFKNRPFHSYMGVKYKKLDFVEDTTGVVYDFHHSIYSTTIYAASNLTFRTTSSFWKDPETTMEFGTGALVTNHISFTKNCYYKGGEVEEYINNLVNTPDKVGFNIDTEGNFKENNDFPM